MNELTILDNKINQNLLIYNDGEIELEKFSVVAKFATVQNESKIMWIGGLKW